MCNHLLKFADDTKLFSQVSTCEDAEKLQKDLNNLHGWSAEWTMLFNAEKCKCVHYGHNNRQYDYFMGDNPIETSHVEKDLGVIITDTLNVTEQCVKASNKANAMLGMINRAIKYKTKEVVVKLYKSLVRPHLDYCIQAWRPFKQKDIDLLEKVQLRATRMISDLSHLDYQRRLRVLNITTLETRRLRADLLEVYKIFNGLESIIPADFFVMENKQTKTRGHPFKITKVHSRLDIRMYSFTQRIVNDWNRLPEAAVMSKNINQFKGHIDKYLRNRAEDYTSQRLTPFLVNSLTTK